MAFGTPVVCSDAASLPEVVRDAAPIFAAGDADALASGLARVLDDGAVTEHLRTLAIMRIITLVIRATLQMGQSCTAIAPPPRSRDAYRASKS
jgi:glycosyltransferase involved in cell wall biosynthesis